MPTVSVRRDLLFEALGREYSKILLYLKPQLLHSINLLLFYLKY